MTALLTPDRAIACFRANGAVCGCTDATDCREWESGKASGRPLSALAKWWTLHVRRLPLSLHAEDCMGHTLHCPHCERAYGRTPILGTDFGGVCLISCPCGKEHVGIHPFGDFE